MVLRCFGLIFVLILRVGLVNGQPGKNVPLARELPPGPTAVSLPVSLVKVPRDARMKTAYLDAFRILSTKNTCSEFYGGPTLATTVLTDLISNMEYGYLPLEVSFQMSGSVTYIKDLESGSTYRRFQRMMVNYRGSFYRGLSIDGLKPPMVGDFPPNTRAARALILMHEIGHLIQRENGHWLLADDGNESLRSSGNTRLIEQICRVELKTLDK